MFRRKDVSLANAIIQSNRELCERITSIQGDNYIRHRDNCDLIKSEIRARDRVDISLEEYDRMQDTMTALRMENERLRTILEKIEVPLDKPIIPGSIQTMYCQDPTNFKRKFRIEFEIDEKEFRK